MVKSTLQSQRTVGNMPADLTSFVDRRRELAEAVRILSTARLLTFTGVGGVGKTRLALKVAAELQRTFSGQVWWVELAPLEEDALLAQTVAEALGLPSHSARPALNSLIEQLADRQQLLVLDNCEHLLDVCADLAAELLKSCPGLRILATSRQPLDIEGEHILPVPPLPVPEPDQEVSAQDLAPALSLFVDRAQSVVPGFAVTAANSTAVAQICRRLDGIPLAIELAASLMSALSPDTLVRRLDNRFQLLTRGNRGALHRQQTLRATIDWSYDQSTPQERMLWARLSVFSGSCDLEAAETVCGDDGIATTDVFELMRALADKSIVLAEHDGSEIRYQLLETIRQYGRELLEASREEKEIRRRHRDWCRRLVQEVEANWHGPQQLQWSRRLRQELPNIRGALEFCLSEPGEARAALEIASTLWSDRRAWISFSEGRSWFERALAADPEPSLARSKALWVVSWIAQLQGDRDAASRWLQECQALAEQLDDRRALARVVQLTGLAALFRGEFSEAIALLDEALARHRELGDRDGLWSTLFQRAMAAAFGNDPRMEDMAAECLDYAQSIQADWARSFALWVSGLAVRDTRPEKAGDLIRDGLRIKMSYDDRLGFGQCVEVLAWIAAARHQEEYAAGLLGAADTIWRSIMIWRTVGAVRGLGHFAGPHDRCEAQLRTALGDKAFEAAFEQGAQLPLDQALAYALDEQALTGSAPPLQAEPAAGPARAADDTTLTRREREVARLVAQGLSNKEIATTLVISQRTAEGHVEHILKKLGFASRAQIVAWAARSDGQEIRKPRAD